MSQDNVEIVKRANVLLERRDWPGITDLDLIDPNVELHGSVGGLEEGKILVGLSEISQAFDTEDRDVWDEHRIEPREFIDAGDRVVVLHREYQRGKGSGVEIVIDTASILDLRDGRIVRTQGYMNPAEALDCATPAPAATELALKPRDTAWAMSLQNVELIRRIYDAWDREESARDFIAADVEYVNPSYAVEPGTRHGRKSFAVVRDTYEDFEIKIERVIDAGDETVVLAHYTASGPVSGVPVAGEHGYVWTVRDGLAVRFQWFQSHREALEAAGLPE